MSGDNALTSNDGLNPYGPRMPRPEDRSGANNCLAAFLDRTKQLVVVERQCHLGDSTTPFGIEAEQHA